MSKNIKKKAENIAKNREKPKPFLKYIYDKDPKTGKKTFKTLELSDNTRRDEPNFLEKILEALKRTSGSDDAEVADRIISMIAWGMSAGDSEDRTEMVNILLQALGPNDESEALMLGQFLTLQDSGMKCLRNANHNEMMQYKQEYFQLAVKLFRCANETMQTLLKYRSKGQQQIQVIHVSGDGKAVIANEMSIKGGTEKNIVEPHVPL